MVPWERKAVGDNGGHECFWRLTSALFYGGLSAEGSSTILSSEKACLYGETRVAALCLVSLLILVSFWELFGTYDPPASVSLRICHVKKSCLRWCVVRQMIICVACSFKPVTNGVSVVFCKSSTRWSKWSEMDPEEYLLKHCYWWDLVVVISIDVKLFYCLTNKKWTWKGKKCKIKTIYFFKDLNANKEQHKLL